MYAIVIKQCSLKREYTVTRIFSIFFQLPLHSSQRSSISTSIQASRPVSRKFSRAIRPSVLKMSRRFSGNNDRESEEQ